MIDASIFFLGTPTKRTFELDFRGQNSGAGRLQAQIPQGEPSES